jgi:hypothetical protein
MNSDVMIREELINLLKGGNAHMSLREAVKDFPEEKINTVFPNGTYSAWDLLEHIRITQWDILNFIINSNYKEISWPDAYWPEKDKLAIKREWEKTILQFEKDNLALGKIVKNSETDLYAKIPHGDGQTILREILVVSDHNSYHIGEFAITRQAMKTWEKNHQK